MTVTFGDYTCQITIYNFDIINVYMPFKLTLKRLFYVKKGADYKELSSVKGYDIPDPSKRSRKERER